jgi:predicted ATP-dependent endonuclease of OLD family
MRLEKIRVTGLRSARDVEIPLHGLTLFLGPNGSGKSTALLALRLLMVPELAVAAEDFWRGDEDQRADQIVITGTFADIDPGTSGPWADYLSGAGLLVLERVFDAPGRGQYLANRLGVREFADIRRLLKGHRDRFNELVDSGAFPGLGRASSRDDALHRMTAWERAHPDQCEVTHEAVPFMELAADDPRSVRAHLQYVFIGALEDPQSHITTTGKGELGALISAAIDLSALEADLVSVDERAREEIKRVLAEQEDVFETAQERITDAVKRFVPGYSVDLAWTDPRTIQSTLPQISLAIRDAEGLATEIGHQGHGIQRSLMFSVLTAHAEMNGGSSRRVIAGIEEPEAFQHPLSARALAKTFVRLSEGRYQIVYSTHSPEFVPASAVDAILLFCRVPLGDGGGFHTRVNRFELGRMTEILADAMGNEDFTEETTRARLEANLDSQILEGLFAKLVVLVEGDQDEALIRGASEEAGVDLDDLGVAVIRSHGKTNIPLLAAFFKTAQVRIYPVFDLDQGSADNSGAWAHDAIRKIVGAPLETSLDETCINDRFACWSTNLGDVVRSEIGPAYAATEESVSADLQFTPKQSRKKGRVVREVLKRCYASGRRSTALDQVTTRIKAGASG